MKRPKRRNAVEIEALRFLEEQLAQGRILAVRYIEFPPPPGIDRPRTYELVIECEREE